MEKLDAIKLAEDVKASISALEKASAALTPLLGFALTNLRGALGAIEGHIAKAQETVAESSTAPQLQ